MTDSQLNTFDQHRALLFGIAWRMLGNPTDAEDILQETFLRWQRAPGSDIRSPRAFLVTIVTRLCLNHLELARIKREQATGISIEELALVDANLPGDTDLADALDKAFSIVLRCLSPLERAVFLLREAFECDYSEVARIVEKSEDNCRQILRRAKERIAGKHSRYEVNLREEETLLQEFLSATASGDLQRLARTLSGEVTLICDGANLGAAVPPPIEGPGAVGQILIGNCQELSLLGANVRRTLLGQTTLLLHYDDTRLRSALALVVQDRAIRRIYRITCPLRLRFLSSQWPPSHTPNSATDAR